MEGYMKQMHKFEKEQGHGQEIGPITDVALLGNSQYKEIRKNFFVCHGVSTTLNLLGFAATGIYLWFLSKKIKFWRSCEEYELGWLCCDFCVRASAKK